MLTMLPYMLASIVPAVSTAAMFVSRRRAATPGPAATVQPEAPEAEPLAMSFRTEPTDVRAMVVGRVEALAERASAACVRVGYAIETGLMCVVAPAALRAAISEAIAGAIQASPGGAVLVSAGRHGGRVRITVVDDGDFSDEAALMVRLRPATEALAMCGTSVQVRTRPGHGVTVELRVPDFTQTAHVQPAHQPQPQHAAAPAQRARVTSAACA